MDLSLSSARMRQHSQRVLARPAANVIPAVKNDNINVYAVMLKEGGHVDFNKSITGQDGDLCDVLIDFFNNTLN